MSRIITFSRYIQRADGSHRKQEHLPTYFVEQILNSFGVDYVSEDYYQNLLLLNTENIVNRKLSWHDIESFYESLNASIFLGNKLHTIRSPKKPFKVGDKFTPAIWMGKPYCSPQIKFWDDIEVKQTWDILLNTDIEDGWINSECFGFPKYYDSKIELLAKNDGLSKIDFLNWFGKNEFKGNVICWDSNLKY